MTKLTNREGGFAHLWLALVAVIVIVGGVGVYVAKHNARSSLSSTTTSPTTSNIKPLVTNLTSLLTEDKVKQIVADDKPGAVVSQIGLVQTASGPVFHVQLEDGSSLDIDADTGDKVAANEVDNNTDGTKLPSNFTPAIDFAQAKQIAQAQVPGGTIMRIQLEVENGVPVYSVRFSTGERVQVNANDGTVVKVEAAKAEGKQPATSNESSQQESGSTTKSTESGSGGSGSDATSTTGQSGSSDSSTSGTSDSGSGTH